MYEISKYDQIILYVILLRVIVDSLFMINILMFQMVEIVTDYIEKAQVLQHNE